MFQNIEAKIPEKEAMKLHHKTREKFNRNIEGVISQADQASWDQGVSWYTIAHNHAEIISKDFDVSLDEVCQVISVLSPGSKWERNILDAGNIVEAFQTKKSYEDVKVATYPQNKKKAWDILKGDFNLSVNSGLKTFNFYKNILNPEAEEYVTIDRHAAKVLEGITKAGSVIITPNQYKKYMLFYKSKAKEIDLKPCQLQAITWITYKNLVGR